MSPRGTGGLPAPPPRAPPRSPPRCGPGRSTRDVRPASPRAPSGAPRPMPSPPSARRPSLAGLAPRPPPREQARLAVADGFADRAAFGRGEVGPVDAEHVHGWAREVRVDHVGDVSQALIEARPVIDDRQVGTLGVDVLCVP